MDKNGQTTEEDYVHLKMERELLGPSSNLPPAKKVLWFQPEYMLKIMSFY